MLLIRAASPSKTHVDGAQTVSRALVVGDIAVSQYMEVHRPSRGDASNEMDIDAGGVAAGVLE